MANWKSYLAVLLVLSSFNLSCGVPATSPPIGLTMTEDIPPTMTGTHTEYVPPTVTATRTKHVPPTVTATRTKYVPPTVTGTPTKPVPRTATATQTKYVPPTVAATEPSMSAIDKKYVSLGGEGGFLGQPLSGESTRDGYGRFRHFQGGSIYWTPNTGAWEVHGLIREKWAKFGWETGWLGYPLTDETITPDGIGRFNHFEHGSIYWTPNTGAWEVHGFIRDRWAALGWETSCLGYPISDEEPSTVNWVRQSRFERGIIRWSPERGAVETCY